MNHDHISPFAAAREAADQGRRLDDALRTQGDDMTARLHVDPSRSGDGNSTVAPPRDEPLAVFRYAKPQPAMLRSLQTVYRDAFTEINEYAVQRHLMAVGELTYVIGDPRIGKYVAYDGNGVAGWSVMTDDLDAWPLVAPEFFARAYPGRRVFYVGFVATRNHAPGVYAALVARMYEDVIAADGIFAMDFCGANVDRLDIARRVNVLLHRLNPAARFGMVDRQEFYVGDFRKDAER